MSPHAVQGVVFYILWLGLTLVLLAIAREEQASWMIKKIALINGWGFLMATIGVCVLSLPLLNDAWKQMLTR